MRTVPYLSVFNGVLRLLGERTDAVQEHVAGRVMEYIDDRMRLAWCYHPWPETVRCSEEHYLDEFTRMRQYAVGDIVYYVGAYYECIQTYSGLFPYPTDTAYWEPATEFRRIVMHSDVTNLPMLTVLGAWDLDPYSDDDACELPYRLIDEGALFGPTAPDTVWIRHQVAPASWIWEAYDAAATYAYGDQVLFGEYVYRCAAATTAGQSPTTTPASWTALEFPERLAMAIKAGAVVDYLGSESQQSKKLSEEPRFEALLDEQVWQLTKLQGQAGTRRT